MQVAVKISTRPGVSRYGIGIATDPLIMSDVEWLSGGFQMFFGGYRRLPCLVKESSSLTKLFALSAPVVK